MEPLLIILVPGLFGGLVLALLIASKRRGTPSTVVPRRLAAPSPSLINMAHIQVEGVGGLALVAVAMAVAVADPRIRLAMIVAAVLGAALALFLIGMRRALARCRPAATGLTIDRRCGSTPIGVARFSRGCAEQLTRSNGQDRRGF